MAAIGSTIMIVPIIIILAAVIGIPLAIVAIIYVFIPLCKGIAWFVRHIFKFVFGEIGDVLRTVGAVLTGAFLIPLVLGNIVIGRWSAAAHFGRAMKSEVMTAGRCVYRIAIGHPAHLLGLKSVVEGIEQRIPEVVAAAPGSDRPSRGRVGQFPGYKIVGSLPGGGSGSKLYVATPDAQKLAAFARSGDTDIKEVVIKAFSLKDGSSLPQIVRESRALDAAKRLGLILEHELSEERFHYVMRYVPGEPLGLVTQRLHASSGGNGLASRELASVLEYSEDLLRTLIHYHAGGLWHKDVKPDNIIVADGQAHLVDFGLVTPLRSAMTLTTHGTEYFRDPEMVRMALKGVKVQDVDGTRFDIYAAGAVLYSMIENSFPAHGGLSQITRNCPEALRWVVRRAMTDYDKRYESASAMLMDVESIAGAPDPFAVLPAFLPSMRGMKGDAGMAGAAAAPAYVAPVQVAPVAAAVPPPIPREPVAVQPFYTPIPPMPAAAPAPMGRTRPNIRIASWWTGRYTVGGQAAAPAAAAPFAPTRPSEGLKPAAVQQAVFRRSPRVVGRSATEQRASARTRAAAARARAHQRMRGRGERYVSGVNSGVVTSLVFLLGLGVVGGVVLIGSTLRVSDRAREAQRDALAAWAEADSVLVAVDEGDVGAGDSDREAGATRTVATSSSSERRVPVHAGSSGRILLRRDASTLAQEHHARVNNRLASLRAAGFDLIGDTAGEPLTEEERDSQIALAATLDNAVGILPFQSVDARDAVRSWLWEHREVALVAWVGCDAANKPIFWMVARDASDKATLDRAVMAIRPIP